MGIRDIKPQPSRMSCTYSEAIALLSERRKDYEKYEEVGLGIVYALVTVYARDWDTVERDLKKGKP
jgi:hypothetical protein